jgi:hypothetical protein
MIIFRQLQLLMMLCSLLRRLDELQSARSRRSVRGAYTKQKQ